MKSPVLSVTSATNLEFEGKKYRCVIGRNGFALPENKQEGDLKTPTGTYPLREVWYRADRLAKPVCALPVRTIQPQDGWCDAPADARYNSHFALGGGGADDVDPTSFEHLWREDGVYDLIVPLGYNDSPPVAGKGSAIFMHLSRPDWRGTEGCVALAQADMLTILSRLQPDSQIEIMIAGL